MRVESGVIASPFACPPTLSRRSALRMGDEVELRIAGLRTVEIARATPPSGAKPLLRVSRSRAGSFHRVGNSTATPPTRARPDTG